jgi:hypothetical protein
LIGARQLIHSKDPSARYGVELLMVSSSITSSPEVLRLLPQSTRCSSAVVTCLMGETELLPPRLGIIPVFGNPENGYFGAYQENVPNMVCCRYGTNWLTNLPCHPAYCGRSSDQRSLKFNAAAAQIRAYRVAGISIHRKTYPRGGANNHVADHSVNA